MDSWWLYLIAAMLLVLIPFMRPLVRLRIRVLRWLHWNWAADLLENHFDNWVLVFRVLVFVAVVVFIVIGWRMTAA